MTPVRLAALVLLLVPFAAPQRPEREVAVTVDDLPFIGATTEAVSGAPAHTRKLLAAFARHKIPAIGFVNEGKLERGPRQRERGLDVLEQWIKAGHELGNHTYSHLGLHSTSVTRFTEDIVRGEPVLTRMLGRRPRYFRHPQLHTGQPIETKHAVDRFLAERGYRVAPVTIDNYDYIFANAYDRSAADVRPRIARTYIDYITAVVSFYEQQSTAIVGREIRQTLLLHANVLNADTMDDLAVMLKSRGYTFVTLDRALEDPAYQSADHYAGPAGITWLHRWAITAGVPGKTFAGEPTVPEWIDRASRARIRATSDVRRAARADVPPCHVHTC